MKRKVEIKAVKTNGKKRASKRRCFIFRGYKKKDKTVEATDAFI